MSDRTMFWDWVAGVYDVFVKVINKKTHDALRTRMEEYIHPSDAVLECACGTGMLTEGIATGCRALVATDFSKKMVDRARAKCGRHGNIRFMIADIQSLDFPDACFDKVVAANVIHLLGDPHQAVRELDRVCRPGGKIIIPTYISRRGENRGHGFVKMAGRIGAGFRQTFTFASYRRFFIDAGYPDAMYILIEGFIPCLIAVIEKKGSDEYDAEPGSPA